ncbi:MAG: transposase [Cyanobacteria bacterium]|nr:transposase [Cyanobacteriota bacterium]
MFVQWHQWKDDAIDWDQCQQSCRPLCQQFEGILQQVVDLGYARKERTPWDQTVRTSQQLLHCQEALQIFLAIHQGIESTNNAAERALRQAVIQCKISLGVQSASAAICRSQLFTLIPNL